MNPMERAALIKEADELMQKVKQRIDAALREEARGGIVIGDSLRRRERIVGNVLATLAPDEQTKITDLHRRLHSIGFVKTFSVNAYTAETVPTIRLDIQPPAPLTRSMSFTNLATVTGHAPLRRSVVDPASGQPLTLGQIYAKKKAPAAVVSHPRAAGTVNLLNTATTLAPAPLTFEDALQQIRDMNDALRSPFNHFILDRFYIQFRSEVTGLWIGAKAVNSGYAAPGTKDWYDKVSIFLKVSAFALSFIPHAGPAIAGGLEVVKEVILPQTMETTYREAADSFGRQFPEIATTLEATEKFSEYARDVTLLNRDNIIHYSKDNIEYAKVLAAIVVATMEKAINHRTHNRPSTPLTREQLNTVVKTEFDKFPKQLSDEQFTRLVEEFPTRFTHQQKKAIRKAIGAGGCCTLL